jgi:anti-sigma factor RsiW
MSLTCDELDTMLPEVLDGSVTEDEATLAAAHLATCEECTAELTELQGVTRLFSEHGTMRLPDDARRRISRVLDLDG